MARIELVRSGGFAGLRMRATVDTHSSEPDAGWYDEALAGLDLPGLAADAARGQAGAIPDGYQYALAVEGDDGSTTSLTCGETDLPEALRPLVDRLLARATREPPG